MDGPDRLTENGDKLTEPQRQAVEHVDGPLVILAGPGSGKTRVITHRIAHLLRQGIAARQILAVTFTNKAADEMRLRLERLAPRQPVWLGTFHRFCARLLRQYAAMVGLQENYSIYDTQDSSQTLKQTIRNLEIEMTHTSVDAVANAISWAKNRLVTPDEYEPRWGSTVGTIVKEVYPVYQQQLRIANAVDFDDLLMHVATLLKENPQLRKTLDDRYRYILVDEYQDTNLAQYAIVRALSIEHPNLAVTGDPDQSIYGWRGANLSNLLDFEKDYPQVKVVRLEQNYRSTPNILRIADHLITHNQKRKPKKLFTDQPEGKPVRLAVYPTGRDEADDLAFRIEEAKRNGRRLADIAIFYRINALSRTIENALRIHHIPYQIVNGLEFYQRKEIKDILSYLHLVNNPRSDASFLRIVNVPPRKIGKRSLELVIAHAARYQIPLLDAAREAGLIESLTKAAAVSIAKFVALMDRLSVSANQGVEDLMQATLHESTYHDWLAGSEREEDQDRLANIEELLTDAREFDQQHPEEGSLEAFLERASLVADTDAWDQDSDRVTLMTMHAAKGLEFPMVFIVAVEEGLLPHERSTEDPDQLEEERRLLFVGITRAEQELQLSHAQYRTFRGQQRMAVPSQFLLEIPREEFQLCSIEPDYQEQPDSDRFEDSFQDLAEEDADAFHALADIQSQLVKASDLAESGKPQGRRIPASVFQLGMVVDHPEYGSGRITNLSGAGQKRTAVVEFFGTAGEKKFRLAHSPLTPGEYLE